MNSDLNQLRLYLLSRGVVRKYVNRLITELTTHFHDRYDQARQRGEDCESAIEDAKKDVGDLRAIAEATLSRPALISWSYRHPIIGYTLAPLVSWWLFTASCLVLMITYGVYRGTGALIWRDPLDLPAIVTDHYLLISLLLTKAIPLTLAAWLLVRTSQRATNPIWPVIGSTLLIVMSWGSYSEIQPPHNEVGWGVAYYTWTSSNQTIIDWLDLPVSLLLSALAIIGYRWRSNQQKRLLTWT